MYVCGNVLEILKPRAATWGLFLEVSSWGAIVSAWGKMTGIHAFHQNDYKSHSRVTAHVSNSRHAANTLHVVMTHHGIHMNTERV